MVGDGRLGEAERFGELADTGFAVVMGSDQRYQPEPGRVGEGLEDVREVGGLAGGEWFARYRRAARRGSSRWLGPGQDRRRGVAHGSSMPDALTSVYVYPMLVTSTMIYAWRLS